MDLITIDKSWVDVLLSVPALPGYDQKVLGKLLGKQPGGMGGNVACAASRLGLRTGMVSWVGDDADGQHVLDDLHRFGVDTTHLVVEANTMTNYTTVLIDPTGEKAIIIVPAAFNTLALDSSLKAYLNKAHLVYCAAYDPDQLERVAHVVRAAGGLLSTDLEPVAGLQDETLHHVLSLVDIAFVDADILGTDDYEVAAQKLQLAGPELIVLGCGSKGSLAYNGQDVIHWPAFTVSVTDTTGAGDCFTAAFLTAYLRQLSLAQSLCYANAAAALSIQAYGARGALPTDKQVQTFLADQNRLCSS